VLHQNVLIRSEILTEDFLFAMLRCAFIFPEDQNLKRDLAVLLVFLLYHECLQFDENAEDNPHRISLPDFFHQNLNLPVESGTLERISSHQVKVKHFGFSISH
jgi:hypothetical protein